MRRTTSYVRLGFLPVLLTALLIQMSCDESAPSKVSSSDTVIAQSETVRPEIPRPAPDATIVDSLSHDFNGVWVADSQQVLNVAAQSDGFIGFCKNGNIRYQVYNSGTAINLRAKQVWIDRQHVHIDMFLESMEGAETDIASAAVPEKGKLFATADLVSDSKMSVLWYSRDFVKAIREKGSIKSPEAFPAVFYYTSRSADCR